MITKAPSIRDRSTARSGPLSGFATRAANNAALIRALTWPVVRFAPTLTLGSRVIVTRHADVVEVLARDTDFTVAELNAARMARVNGPFVLGMDRSPLYERERSILQQSIEPGDAERIRTIVERNAGDLVEEVRASGRLDVVQQLARPAAVRLVGEYFGVPGPDEQTMMRWMRAIFYEAFLNIGENPAVREAGDAAGDELHAYLDELIAVRKSELAGGQATADDLVSRLLQMQGAEETRLSDEGVRRNVSGVIVGAVDTTSKAVAHAVEQLIKRPAVLRRAAQAAKAGDVETVGRYAFEALRFNPINPALARHASWDATLADGTRWAHRIPSGKTVYLGILPAMFDPRTFRRPGRFDPDRPFDAYLHFGGGLHSCFGRYVNVIQIPEIVAAVIRLDGLRFAGSPRRAITYDGPFPDKFEVEFDGGRG